MNYLIQYRSDSHYGVGDASGLEETGLSDSKNRARNLAEGTERMSVVARLPWMMTMLAVTLTALVYPLRLQDKWLNKYVPDWRDNASGWWWYDFLNEQVTSFISYFHSPLTLKGSLGGACLIAVIFLALAGRAIQPLVIPSGQARTRAYRPSLMVSLALCGFVGWTMMSAFWSPTPRLSFDGLAWVLLFGAFTFYLVRRGLAADELRQWSVLLIGLGLIITVFAFLQAAEPFGGFIFKFMYKFDDPEKRNLYGSLLGHNTAVAHFMMISAFPALALALDPRRGLLRWGAMAYVPVAVVTALVTQSRSIWVFGAMLAVAFLYFIGRLAGRRWPWRLTFYIGGTLLFALALQLIPSPSNPFYIESNPILRRFKDLTPGKLKDEARVRLVICSLPLVAEKPIIGHGLYAFQYVYAKAQGDYFARNPDSKLGRTSNRSHMAHNEYLQILVDSGVIGLGLFVFLLVAVARSGRRINLGLDTSDRLLHAAFGFAVIGSCLDALVNFPWHVPQLALPWLVNIAAFCAWRADEPQPTFVMPGIIAEESSSADGASAQLRPVYVARLVAGWAFLFAIPMAMVFPVRFYQADINYMSGMGYVNAWRAGGAQVPPSMQESFFVEGDQYLREAVAIQPSHDLARYGLGELYYLSGVGLARQESAAAAGMQPLYAPAISRINMAMEHIERSTASLRYHNTYFMLALCHDMLRSMTNDPAARAMHDRAFKENLDTCLFYSPTVFEGLVLMDRWLASQPKADKQRVVFIRRRIKQHFPIQFRDRYQFPVSRLMTNFDWELAVKGVDSLLEVQPDNADYLIMAVDANMYAGNYDRLFEVVNALRNLKVDPEIFARDYEAYRNRPSHPMFWCQAALWEAIASRDWGRAITELDYLGVEDARGVARLWAIQQYLREKLGIENLPSRFEKFEGMPEEDWKLFRAEIRAESLCFLFQENERARAAYEERLAMPGAPPGVKFWITYGWLARRLGDAALLVRCVEKIREIEPQHPVLERLNSPIAVAPVTPETGD